MKSSNYYFLLNVSGYLLKTPLTSPATRWPAWCSVDPGGAGTRLVEGGTAGLPRVTALTPDTSPVLPAAAYNLQQNLRVAELDWTGVRGRPAIVSQNKITRSADTRGGLRAV